MTFAPLEFDRVLELVASFALSQRGDKAVRTTLPHFSAGEGSLQFALTREMQELLAVRGQIAFDGLDAAELLADGGATEAIDLACLVGLVRRIVEARSVLEEATGPRLCHIRESLPQLEVFLAFCQLRLSPSGEVLDSASPQLAQARAARERHRQAIVDALEAIRRQRRDLQAPFTIRRDRYCLPVPAGQRADLAGLVLDASASGATVFLEPFALVELNNSLAEATATARAEEERVLAEVAAGFGRHREELLRAAGLLAELDARQARVLFGRACSGTLLDPGAGVVPGLVGARHPLLDPTLAPLRQHVLGEAGSSRPIVPLDLVFPEGARLVLLSGPNAGGKTVALKTVGLVALMTQAGIPALVEEGSALPSFSRLWCHIGDEQNLLSDLSTFTGAMRATAALLAEADADTLVLYDELGSGTDPEEGAALAAALLEELARRGCWTVATAHLVTVAAHLESVAGAVNAAMGFDESSGRPTYRLHLGIPGRSRGLAIAASCGVPEPLLARARAMVSQAFLAIDSYLATLQEERDRLASEEETLRARQDEAAAARRAAEAEEGRLASERERVRRRLDEERDQLRRKAKEQLAAALTELEKARESGEFPGKKRLATVRRTALAFADDEPADAPTGGQLAPGDAVRVRGIAATGTVGRAAGNRLEVLLGDKRLWVEKSACEPVVAEEGEPRQAAVVKETNSAPETELHLIGMTQEEAREGLERFLDRALFSGVRRVRVVHGHGTGTLRRVVHDVLASHPAVASFGHPPQFRGGTGVTEVELES